MYLCYGVYDSNAPKNFTISDAMTFVLCVPNMLGLVLLAPVVRLELGRLMAKEAQGAPA